ncbi:MAG: alanine racemase [Clostridiales bacterium]|nr:alanine racemase [Clostridiales bacterium]
MGSHLTIDQGSLLQNLRTIKAIAQRSGVSISVVTKGLVGHEGLVKLLVENGADSICEAHIQNLKKFKDLPAEKWLIRSPLPSEVDDVVRYADVSLVTEMSVLELLSAAAAEQGRKHKAVIMLELGELREGCMPDELVPLCEACLALPSLELHGIGANLSCINEIIPNENNMAVLAEAASEVENVFSVRLPLVSGGSSSAVKMLEEGGLPPAINHLRIGEAILLGNIVCYDMPYEGAREDIFTLEAEVIEAKSKPSLPWGERAPGTAPAGQPSVPGALQKRALVAIGKQDVFAQYLAPIDTGIRILGDTSDCLVADVTDAKNEYKPGDTVSFRLKYNGLVSAMASSYVEKILL